MNNNRINNNEPDAFSEKLKSKLENHQLAPDADLWNSIQQAVEAKKRLRLPVWLWIPISSVAVIALVLLFLRPNQPADNLTVSKPAKTQNIQVQPKKNGLLAKASTPGSINKAGKKNKNTINIYSKSQVIIEPVELGTVEDERKRIAFVDSTSKAFNALAHTDAKDSIIPDIPLVKTDTVSHRLNIATLTEKSGNQPVRKLNIQPKYKNQWLLAAAFGSGSSSSSGLENVPSATLSDNIVKTGASYSSILSPQNFSDVHYSLPLSFGLKVRNRFSESVSIETGLIYSYLQTDFSNSGFTTTDARLGLHYLGIPLSLNLKLWSNPKWEVSVSGGGTVEKGLRSIYQQTQNNTFQTWVTTAQTNIDGFQFSANSALGLAYKIRPKIAIYFEPQFSYYFQNNQPISIRSKQPLVFGLNIGLRYDLKPSAHEKSN